MGRALFKNFHDCTRPIVIVQFYFHILYIKEKSVNDFDHLVRVPQNPFGLAVPAKSLIPHVAELDSFGKHDVVDGAAKNTPKEICLTQTASQHEHSRLRARRAEDDR